jgi:hypothetical protein
MEQQPERCDREVVADLIARAVHGQEPAWCELVDRYHPVVAAIIASFSLPGRAAEDINQTVWLRLVERLHTLPDARALLSWLVATTRKECLALAPPTKRTISNGRSLVLLGAVAELPSRDWRLLRMLMSDPPVASERIARELGVPVADIGRLRLRALARIRNHPAVSAQRDGDDLNPTGGRALTKRPRGAGREAVGFG